MADYTDTEQDTLRQAAFGAMALVSKAESGFFDMFKESMAGSQALASNPKMKELLGSGFVAPPKASDAGGLAAAVLGSLTAAMTLLRGKDPADAEAFKGAVLDASAKVAEAADGTSANESALVEKIRAALA